MICTAYRPPNYRLNLWKSLFLQQVELAYLESKQILITGDFNIDLLHPNSDESEWADDMESYQLTQIVKMPTRVTDNSQKQVDHIYVNNTNKLLSVKVPCLALSDHYPTCLSYSNPVKCKNFHQTIEYRFYKHFVLEQFLDDLRSVNWDQLDIYLDPNDALTFWDRLFKGVCDKHAPLIKRKVKK